MNLDVHEGEFAGMETRESDSTRCTRSLSTSVSLAGSHSVVTSARSAPLFRGTSSLWIKPRPRYSDPGAGQGRVREVLGVAFLQDVGH